MNSTFVEFYYDDVVSNARLTDDTITPMSYRDRITVELTLNFCSWLLNLALFLFVRFTKSIWQSLKSTIVFVTTGSLIINIPLLTFQFWMVINLQLGHEPRYSIFLCSWLKNFCSSTTSAYQVLPFAVSIYRYRTVVRKEHPRPVFVVIVQIWVIVLFTIYAILNYPLGENSTNDVCLILRFSYAMEMIRIFTTLFFNFFAIFVNFYIMRFVENFAKENKSTQRKRIQLTRSLFIQSMIPVLVSIPLLALSFHVYFGFDLPPSFSSHWYAMTFLGPFLTPLSSILGLASTRKELIRTISCGYIAPAIQKASVVTVIGHQS
ncbi:unnamed protein product [Caenorhabditis bovis]|uniref:Uncharacterized protein n=1 Tax=Caenorhabditis bovis TaxID=2654633 RepID=A0A8S1F3V3_9PELO|nr:unnamed protein product [Caenorhabditis bovis]